MNEFSKYVGLDTHKDTIAVALGDVYGGAPRYYGQMARRPEKLTKLVLNPWITLTPMAIPARISTDNLKRARRIQTAAMIDAAGLFSAWLPGKRQRTVAYKKVRKRVKHSL